MVRRRYRTQELLNGLLPAGEDSWTVLEVETRVSEGVLVEGTSRGLGTRHVHDRR